MVGCARRRAKWGVEPRNKVGSRRVRCRGCEAQNRAASAPCLRTVLEYFCTSTSAASLSTNRARAMQASTALLFELRAARKKTLERRANRLLDLLYALHNKNRRVSTNAARQPTGGQHTYEASRSCYITCGLFETWPSNRVRAASASSLARKRRAHHDRLLATATP